MHAHKINAFAQFRLTGYAYILLGDTRNSGVEVSQWRLEAPGPPLGGVHHEIEASTVNKVSYLLETMLNDTVT